MYFHKRKTREDPDQKRKELNVALELWPIAIWQSRYGGVYEGGRWIAIGNCQILPQHMPMMDEDAKCMEFWESREADHIGRGATPNDALQDLLRRNKDLENIVDSFFAVDWSEFKKATPKKSGHQKKFFRKRPF